MNTKPMEKVSVIPQEESQALVPVTPMSLLQNAVANGNMELAERLMNLQDRWSATQARIAFDNAVAHAKAEIPVIARNATGHNAKKYADFAAIAKVVDPILGKHGLSYRFRTVQTDKISVTCILFGHGHSEENTLAGPSDTSGNKNAIQAIGSTLTYLQRYSLVQALGLAASNDDDGKAVADAGAITPEQATELAAKCKAVAEGFDESFCNYFGIATIADLPAKDYQRALIAIGKKTGPAK